MGRLNLFRLYAILERLRRVLSVEDRSARLGAALEANPGLAAEIPHLRLLDDPALWNAAQTRMPQPDSERMEELHRKQRLTGLSEAEAQELARLEQQYERVILVRSHSALLLEQRGHKSGWHARPATAAKATGSPLSILRPESLSGSSIHGARRGPNTSPGTRPGTKSSA